MDRTRILVVEDETTLRSILGTVLEEAGHQVHTVSTGEEALERLPRESYDVVITDKNLPGITGLELKQRVGQQHPQLRMILVTGYPSVGAAVEALEEGFLAFLVKPFQRLDEPTAEVGRVMRLRTPHERHARSQALKARIEGDTTHAAPASALIIGSAPDTQILAARVGAARTVCVPDVDAAQAALGQTQFGAVVATEVSALIDTRSRLEDAAMALAADASFADVLELIRVGASLAIPPQALSSVEAQA
ncbi:MAG: response regulator [Myxococcota bacterium]